MNRPARTIFLDKDGTLVENMPYNVDADQMRLTARAADGLRLLARRGYRFVVVSNQPGVALGLFPEHALRAVEERLSELLGHAGIALDGFYYCPHLPTGRVARYRTWCDCRKPASGLLTRAARRLEIDLGKSWMVGDILDDIEAGRTAGCKTVLIDNGNETEWDLTPARRPLRVATDLLEAAALILLTDEGALQPAQA